MNINIIPTSSAEHIGKLLKDKKDVNVIFPDKNKEGKNYFPDGEVYMRLSKVNELSGRTVIIHSGAPNPNRGLVELEMLLEIVSKSKTEQIEVFFTYFPYGMQDNIFREGETNAAKNIIEKITRYYGVRRIYTIDAHFEGDTWEKMYPITNISALSSLKKAASKDYPDAVYLAPDSGCQRRTGLKGTEKIRTDSYMTETQSNEEFRSTVKDKMVGVVDDLLETGGTLDSFYDESMKYGAKGVFALITHGVLPQGIERIQNKYAKLYMTNTIDRNANVDISDLILDTIENTDWKTKSFQQ